MFSKSPQYVKDMFAIMYDNMTDSTTEAWLWSITSSCVFTAQHWQFPVEMKSNWIRKWRVVFQVELSLISRQHLNFCISADDSLNCSSQT